MVSRARTVAAAAFSLAGCVATSVFAAPSSTPSSPRSSSPSFEWTAPAECPQAAEMRAKVESIVGPALAVSLNASVAVSRTVAGRYAADVHVTVSGREGERSLDESSCRVVAEAAAAVLAMSLMIEAAPPPHESARVDSAPAPSPSPALTPSPAEPRFALGSLAMANDGTLPSVAAGVGLEAAFYPVTRLRLEASVVRWLAQSSAVAGQDFGGRFQLTSADLRGCVSLLGRSVTLGPCAGIDFEHIDAYGVRATSTNGGSTNGGSPLVGALLRWTPARWLGLNALVDVAFPLERPQFVIQGVPAGAEGFYIYSPARAALRSEISAEVRF
jgi:hypothetical protein